MVIEKPTSLRDPKKTCYAKIQEFLFCTIYMNTVKREEKNAQFNGRKERWVSIVVADALKIVTIKRTSTKLVRKQVLLTRVWKGIFEIRHSPKIGHRMRDYVCVTVGNAGNRHDLPVLAAKANQPGER